MIPEHPVAPGCLAKECQREILSNMCDYVTRTGLSKERRIVIALRPGGLHWVYRNCGRTKGTQVGRASIKSLDLGLACRIQRTLIEY